MAQNVAIITGGGSGIGRATAIQLAQSGFLPVVVGRTRSTLDETIGLAGAGEAIVADVSDPSEHDRLVRETLDRHGRIDATIHCAGVAPMLSVEETTHEMWRRTIDSNLSAAFYLARAVWLVFRRQGGGVIVQISSLASRDPFPGFAAYGSAKAGMNLLGLSLAREGEPHGIRVHTIAPGSVETEMFRSLPGMRDWPAERTMSPGDVARVVVSCVRGDLRHTSGEVIYIHQSP